jgi:phenylpropionate dioxygenase-like ring-hydroxylating dioxygenase large terminal subunit
METWSHTAMPPSVYSIPYEYFTDPMWFPVEERKIWRKTWQFGCLQQELPSAGSYMKVHIGTTEVIVTRGLDHVVRCFYNVCPHRGTELVSQANDCRRSLQCRYHGWTFRHDGTLLHAPRQEHNGEFSPDGINLIPLQVAEIGPMIFINGDVAAPSLRQVAPGWASAVEENSRDFSSSSISIIYKRFEVNANWKVLIENNLECYHCPINHPVYARAQPTTKDLVYFPDGMHMRFTFVDDGPDYADQNSVDGFYSINPGERQRPIVNFLWPNLSFNMQPGDGILVLSTVLPTGPQSCVYERRYCFLPQVSDQQRSDVISFLDQVASEDVPLSEANQRGLNAEVLARGNLMLPWTDLGVQWHEGHYATFMDL